MAWLLEPRTLGESGATNVNFLWKDDSRPIYVMDNHRVALWCWAQEVKFDDDWSLLHLDRHWDLGSIPEQDIQRAASEEFLSFSLRAFLDENSTQCDRYRLIRWDNYIEPFFSARRNFKQAFLHARQVTQGTNLGRLQEAYTQLYHFSQADEFVAAARAALSSEEEDVGKTIVNLDLDFFFASPNCRRLIHREFVEEIAEFLDPIGAGQHLGVATICLSPECCGGWNASMGMLEELCDTARLDWPLVEQLRRLPQR